MQITEQQAIEIATEYVARNSDESHEYESSRFIEGKQFDDGLNVDASWVINFRTESNIIHQHGAAPIDRPSITRRVRVRDSTGKAEKIREL